MASLHDYLAPNLADYAFFCSDALLGSRRALAAASLSTFFFWRRKGKPRLAAALLAAAALVLAFAADLGALLIRFGPPPHALMEAPIP